MSTRRPGAAMLAREAALQMVYALDLGGQQPAEIERWYVQAHPLEPEARERAMALLGAVVERRERIEALIEHNAIGWRLPRMSVVDRSLLKLATAELLASPAPSPGGVVRAAVKLARKFSQPEAVSFIQGLLEAIARDIAAPTLAVHHAE